MQTSWYLASHPSYGLYTNTGFIAQSAIWSNLYVAAPYFAANMSGGAGYLFYGDNGTSYNSNTKGQLMMTTSNYPSNARTLNFEGTTFEPYPTNTITCGTSTLAWSAVWSYAFSNASDGRLKEHIRPTVFGTEFIKQLRPVDFEWKDNPGVYHQGFVAQEVAALDPTFSAIGRNAQGEAVGLDYSKFVVPMIATIQELLRRIDRLESGSHT
jgi:hypothetical protein